MAITVIKTYGRRAVAAGKSKKGLIIGISLLAATAIGLFIWHLHEKKKAKLLSGNTEANNDPNTSTSGLGNTSASISNVSTGSTTTPSAVNTSISSSTNPITVQSGFPKDTLTFQKWANKNKGTTLVEDGKFGPLSKAAWNLYGLEYQKIENMKLQPFTDYKGNPLGKVVYSKYVGSDIFDGTLADSVFKKIGSTTKVQAMGKVAKVLPTNQGSIVVFSGAPGKFYKMHSAHLNIFA
jgi:hypothetical protein